MDAGDVVVPLRRWIASEAVRVLEWRAARPAEARWRKQVALLEKTAVAYGIAELLQCAARIAASTPPDRGCRVDNFVVRLSSDVRASHDGSHAPSWSKVRGVGMLSPPLSARIAEPLFLSCVFDNNAIDDINHGRCLEVTILPTLMENNHSLGQTNARSNPSINQHTTSHVRDCRLFGILLYELYAGIPPFDSFLPDGLLTGQDHFRGMGPPGPRGTGSEPPKKKPTVRYDKKKGKPYSTPRQKSCVPLRELGFPPSVSRLVLDLIDDPGAYATLGAASGDLKLLLRDPACFLFERRAAAMPGGCASLSFREHTLYGREREVSLITDAFCRVSGGKNEAFFIGGYSGSGKTALVRSLMSRVTVAGGYVLTEKAEQIHGELPLLGVLSAFNNLCALIRERNTHEELCEIGNKLNEEFDSDLTVLAQLLPNSVSISSQHSIATEKDCNGQMSFYNICCVLQRFMRVVSSVQCPVMLFLDDCQWCSASSLELIQAILSDARGRSCFFFVGSFRDNEVEQEHPVSRLMASLNSKGVSTTKLILNGLAPGDVNMMLADALCMLPRCCTSLSEIVFQKTKGNPFFVREFLHHLVESRRLKYNAREEVWIWDDNEINAEDITDNVLYLLTRKMASFPEKIQSTLTIFSCFGIKVEGVIVEHLCMTSESNFQDGLDRAIREGCIKKVGTSFKFVHDKVREAAYSFIPEKERRQFHYKLGKSLYSVSRECQMSRDAFFSIVDQINFGIPNLILHEMIYIVAELNVGAGSRAMEGLDYVTAQAYFNNALKLLPKSHWMDSYEVSLRLFFARSKAAYSLGNIGMACDSLKEILNKGGCLEDKLDAYHLYVRILISQGKNEAWSTCCSVLSKLNEEVPDSVNERTIYVMVKQTGETLSQILDGDLLNMQDMNSTGDSTLLNALQFYQLLLCIAFIKKPAFMACIACRMVQMSLNDGLCKDSIIVFVQYAAVVCHQSTDFGSIQGACRIGNVVMRLLKRFGSSIDSKPKIFLLYFGFVAPFTEQLQQCTNQLRKSFKVGMTSIKIMVSLYSSVMIMKLSIFSGENLQALLKDVDDHIGVMGRLNHKLLLPYLIHYRETILTLIGEHQTESQSNATVLCKGNSASALDIHQQEGMFMNRALQAFWCGHAQRCDHYAKKTLALQSEGQHTKLMVLFYSAVNSFRGVRNKNGIGSQYHKLGDTFKNAINVLKPASDLSPGNFQNKVHLLEAEMFSFEKNYVKARASYGAAITSSCASRFLHEQGLACELAGLHYKKVGEAETALRLFHQAKDCYKRWGSQMKVESISQYINPST